jgi:tripartite-type tricarboxylate transporter receptor subunit TctC
MMHHLSTAALVMLLALVGAAIPARAQYPDPAKRITLVVPFSAGGSNDILSRAIGQKLSEAWQVPVIIENQVGASGSLGAAPKVRRMAIRS